MFRPVFAAVVAAAMLSTGCATQPPVPLNFHTASGLPEIVIPGQAPDVVRSRLIERLVTHGFTLDNETPSMLAASKEVPGMQETFLRLALTNASSTPVRIRHTFTILKVSEGTKVMESSTYYSTMPLGQVRSMPVTAPSILNEVQASLERLADSFKG